MQSVLPVALPHPIGMLHHGQCRRYQQQRVVRVHNIGCRRLRDGSITLDADADGPDSAALCHNEPGLCRLRANCGEQISHRRLTPHFCRRAPRWPDIVLLRAGDDEKQRA